VWGSAAAGLSSPPLQFESIEELKHALTLEYGDDCHNASSTEVDPIAE